MTHLLRLGLALSLLFVGSVGCGTVKSDHSFGRPDDPGVVIRGELAELRVKDMRSFVQEDTLVVPLIAVVGESESGEVKIRPETVDVLRRRATKLFSGVGPKANVLVVVEAGDSRFESGFISEELHARVKLRVEVRHAASDAVVWSQTAMSQGEWSAIKATSEESSEILQRAMLIAFEKALLGAGRLRLLEASLAGAESADAAP